VQSGGIYFSGMYYTSAGDREGLKFARARAKGRESIEVWHDPTKPEHLWMRGDDHSFVQYNLRASEVRYQGHRLEEIQDMLAMIKHTSPEEKYVELTSKVRLDDQVQSIIAQATAEKKLAPDHLSAAQSVADIRGNRAIEKAAERAGSVNPALAPPSVTAPHVPPPVPAVSETYGQRSGEVINLLSRLRRKNKPSP